MPLVPVVLTLDAILFVDFTLLTLTALLPVDPTVVLVPIVPTLSTLANLPLLFCGLPTSLPYPKPLGPPNMLVGLPRPLLATLPVRTRPPLIIPIIDIGDPEPGELLPTLEKLPALLLLSLGEGN